MPTRVRRALAEAFASSTEERWMRRRRAERAAMPVIARRIPEKLLEPLAAHLASRWRAAPSSHRASNGAA